MIGSVVVNLLIANSSESVGEMGEILTGELRSITVTETLGGEVTERSTLVQKQTFKQNIVIPS